MKSGWSFTTGALTLRGFSMVGADISVSVRKCCGSVPPLRLGGPVPQARNRTDTVKIVAAHCQGNRLSRHFDTVARSRSSIVSTTCVRGCQNTESRRRGETGRLLPIFSFAARPVAFIVPPRESRGPDQLEVDETFPVPSGRATGPIRLLCGPVDHRKNQASA